MCNAALVYRFLKARKLFTITSTEKQRIPSDMERKNSYKTIRHMVTELSSLPSFIRLIANNWKRNNKKSNQSMNFVRGRHSKGISKKFVPSIKKYAETKFTNGPGLQSLRLEGPSAHTRDTGQSVYCHHCSFTYTFFYRNKQHKWNGGNRSTNWWS